MGEVMMFPETVDEFMEQYKEVDSQHVYSNGTEYVPIYRMRQWFDHCGNEVRHGRWMPTIDGIEQCSECLKAKMSNAEWKYCPNCGARMDEK